MAVEYLDNFNVSTFFSFCLLWIWFGSGDHTVKLISCKTGLCHKTLGGHRRTPWVVSINAFLRTLLSLILCVKIMNHTYAVAILISLLQTKKGKINLRTNISNLLKTPFFNNNIFVELISNLLLKLDKILFNCPFLFISIEF